MDCDTREEQSGSVQTEDIAGSKPALVSIHDRLSVGEDTDDERRCHGGRHAGRFLPWPIMAHVYIEASAPTRIDLAGGPLDIWPLYLFHEHIDGDATVHASFARIRDIVERDGRKIESRDAAAAR